MTEPIPSPSTAADAVDDETSANLPNNAEDRKAAAALNSLNANEMSQDNGETATKQPSAADQEALGKAMSRLEIASGISKKDNTSKKVEAKKDGEVKKKIKIAAEDVNFLVRTMVALSVSAFCLHGVIRLTSSISPRTKPPNFYDRTMVMPFRPSKRSLPRPCELPEEMPSTCVLD